MTPQLYERITLTRDIPLANLYAGDVAVVVEYLEHPADGEMGAVLEVFNILGESIDVVTVPISAIASLSADLIPSVRVLNR